MPKSTNKRTERQLTPEQIKELEHVENMEDQATVARYAFEKKHGLDDLVNITPQRLTERVL